MRYDNAFKRICNTQNSNIGKDVYKLKKMSKL